MARAFAEAGRPELRAEIECHNGIPVGRGLGSSAAAIVGGLVLADALAGGPLGRSRILELAVEIEGHADNVAAALYGGFTVTAPPPNVTCARIDPARGLAAVVVIGEQPLSTALARQVLPAEVPHADAAANAGAAALVALGIAFGEPDYLVAGLSDRIHESYRALLVPDFDAVKSALAAVAAAPAILSGAGPTMLSLVQGDDDVHALDRARSIADAVRPALAEIGRGRVIALEVDRTGAVVL
jgi:homoserine kinase